MISTRKTICLTCALLYLLLIPLGAWGQQLPPDIQAIKDRGKLIVSQYKGYFAPFFYRATTSQEKSLPSINDHGQIIVGRDIYLAKSLAKILGVELEVRRTAANYDQVCQEVAAGHADIGLSGLTATPRRSMFVRFSAPYAEFPYVILTNRLLLAKHYGAEKMEPANLIDRLNRPEVTFSSEKGTAMSKIIKSYFPKAQLRLIEERNQSYDDVAEGQVWAALANTLDLELNSRKNPQLGLYILPVPFQSKTDKISIAVAPDKPNLLAFINVTLGTHRLFRNVNEFLADYYPDLSAGKSRAELRQKESTKSGLPGNMAVWTVVMASTAAITLLWLALGRWGRRRS